MSGKVERRRYPYPFKLFGIPAAYSPHFANVVKPQRLNAFLIIVYQAAVVIAWIFLGEMGCHLGKSLGGGDSDTYRNANRPPHPVVQVTPPLLQLLSVYPLKNGKSLVNGIPETLRSHVTDDCHNTSGKLAIQFIVRREHLDMCIGEKLFELIVRRTSLHPHELCLLASRHHTSVVV